MQTFRDSLAAALTVAVVLWTAAPVGQAATAEEEFRRKQQEAREQFQQQRQEALSQWEAWEEQQQAEWRKHVDAVRAKWGDEEVTTDQVWVDYTDDLEGRTKVDFENGAIVAEVLVPVDEPEPQQAGASLLTQKIEQTFVIPDDLTGQPVLEDQLQTAAGDPVDEANLSEYLTQEVAPKVEVEPEPIQTDQGPMQVVKVEIPMVPDHLRKRAGRYKGEIAKQAQRWELDPALITAIIHTESSFNPKARSPVGAYGLMQIIPKWAGRDAYKHLHGRDRLLSKNELFNPSTNIELGAAYVDLLGSRHVKGVSDATKRDYLVICAYNWGIGNIQSRVVRKHNIDAMSAEELYKVLQRTPPRETRDYLERVTERQKMYRGLFVE